MKRKHKMYKSTTILPLVIVFLLIGLSLVSGCIGSEGPGQKEPQKEQNQNDIPETKGSEILDWCTPGTQYNSISDYGKVTMNVIGKTTYKGRTVCKSEYISPDNTSNMTMYVSQDGKFTWQVIEEDGKIYEGGINNP